MKIFQAYFEPMYPVPSGLIIAAKSKADALEMAKKTVKHTEILSIVEIEIDRPKIIFYESGDY